MSLLLIAVAIGLLLACICDGVQQPGDGSSTLITAYSADAAEHTPALLAAMQRQALYLPSQKQSLQTAYVSQPLQQNSTTLLKAVQDQSVTDIVLSSSYLVGDEIEELAGRSFLINRNITIRGMHGTADVLDLDYKRAVLELCSSCSVVFTNITLAGERRGNGSPIDFFVGRPGSAIYTRNMSKLRRACTAAAATGGVVENTPRSKHIMLGGPTEQVFAEVNVSFQGRDFPNTLLLIDYAVDQPVVFQEGRGHSGGYAQSEVATLRLCKAVVQADCLQRKSPDACVNEVIDQVIAEEQGRGRGSSNNSTIAVAVAVPIAAVALLAAGGVFWWHRRRRKQRCAKRSGDAERGWTANTSATGDGPADVYNPRGAGKGWQLAATHTAPGLEDVSDRNIHFGELVGAGSFGRVYRARWAGKDVAVKVIQHDQESANEVYNEVELMLSFHHKNIVRAFYCVTYTKLSASSVPGGTATLGSSSLRQLNVTGGQTASSRTASSAAQLLESQQQMLAGSGSEQLVVTDGSSSERDDSASNSASQRKQQGGRRVQLVPVVHGSSAGGGGASSSSQGQSDSATTRSRAAPSSSIRSTGKTSIQGKAETWIVLEYCDLGTLGGIFANHEEEQQRMLMQPDGEGLMQRLLLLRDAAQGMHMLHSQSVCHGDLNARNVLVSSDASAECGMVAKLADLGLSRVIKQHKTHRTTQTVGTMSHMPPELLRYGRMSPAVDVYAFGIMMWEVYTGGAAFKKLHYGQFFEAIVLQHLRPTMPVDMPQDYKLLMQWCWNINSGDRPPAGKVVEVLSFMIDQRWQQQEQVQLHPDLRVRANMPTAAFPPLPQPEVASCPWSGDTDSAPVQDA